MIILTHEILDLVTDNNAFIVLVKSIAKRASYSDQSCFPSIATMEKDTGFSKNTVINGCKWLRENGIIQVIKRKNEKGGDTSNFYVVDTDLIKIIGKLKTETPVQNLNTPSAEFEHPPVQNLNTNHKDNLTTSPFNQKKEKFSAENYVSSLDLDLDLKNALLSWLEIRKVKKTPTTQKAIDLALGKLKTLDLKTQIETIEKSVIGGWTTFYIDEKQKTFQPENQFNQIETEYV